MFVRRGRDTLRYISNTSRYTYPHPHTWPDPNASGILWDTTGYDRIHPLVRIPAGCTRHLQIRLEYEEDLVSASYSPHCSRSTCPPAQGPARRRPCFPRSRPLPRRSARRASRSDCGMGYCRIRIDTPPLFCILLYPVSYRDGILYLNAMPPSWARIHLYSHRTCCISIVSDGFPTRAPRYI